MWEVRNHWEVKTKREARILHRLKKKQGFKKTQSTAIIR